MKGNQINWNQVFYFCQITLHGSIKEAAAQLGLTSSTLSEHLNQLEKDLEVDLFHRQHRRLTLTPQGSRLFQHAKQMFEASQRLIDNVSPVPLGSYPVSVAIVAWPGTGMAYRVIEDYLNKFGPLNMRVAQTKHEDLERGVLEGKFDFGFSDRGTERKDIIPKLLHSSRLRFFVSENLAGKPLRELIETLPLLLLGADTSARGFVEHLLDDLDLTARHFINCEYPAFLHALCVKGRGIGVFSDSAVRYFQLPLVAVEVPPGTLEIQDKLYLLWARDAERSETVTHLLELVAENKGLGGTA